MTYPTFAKLFKDTAEYPDRDEFIADCGWLPEIDEYTNHIQLVQHLNLIWDLAHMTVREVRERLSISRAEMSQKYVIPKRTLENWEAEVNTPPPYVLSMICYCAFCSIIIGDIGADDEDE